MNERFKNYSLDDLMYRLQNFEIDYKENMLYYFITGKLKYEKKKIIDIRKIYMERILFLQKQKS